MKTQLTRSLLAGMVVMLALSTTALAKDIVDTAVAAGKFKTLATALEKADLVDALRGRRPFTVLAPTDEAFAKLPQGTVESLLERKNKARLQAILKYHVIPGRVPASAVFRLNSADTLNGQRLNVSRSGGGLRVDKARIVATDIAADNGVIHVIDSVLMPAQDKIPAVANNAGSFGTLLTAAKAAGLVEALSGEGPLTVFAPTDEAFGKLPDGAVENLLKPENRDRLQAILKYHVVSGRLYADQAVKAQSAQTLQGKRVRVGVDAGGVKINDARVVKANVDTANGVIHIIDSVLMPPKKDKLSAHSARQMISWAIHQGVPVFNRGHHAQCAEIYRKTMKTMMAADIDGAPEHAMTPIKHALRMAEQTDHATRKAWILRRGLDASYQALGRMETSAP